MVSHTAALIRLMPCQHKSPPAAVDSSETLPGHFGTTPAEVQKIKKQTKSKLLQKGYNWSAHFHYVYEISPLQFAVSKFLAQCEKDSAGPSQRTDEDVERK